MAAPTLTSEQLEQVDDLVKTYVANQKRLNTFAKVVHTTLTDAAELIPFVHFSKYRVKDAEHFRHKVIRKYSNAIRDGSMFDITRENLFQRFGDLAGVRILHLHTSQFERMHPIILKILSDAEYQCIEPPTAHTWDREHEGIFSAMGIEISNRESMYTSVHYVIEQNKKTMLRCEIQVRTLAEELWGEVSHIVDYPDPSASIACSEQLKVLARVTSAGTRLVDSIIRSREEHSKLAQPETTLHNAEGASQI